MSQESRGWWNRDGGARSEWTYEGDRKHKQVAVDGYRTRYPGGVHCWMHSERRSDTQFGWHRRIHILSHERYMGQDVFYVPENT